MILTLLAINCLLSLSGKIYRELPLDLSNGPNHYTSNRGS